MKKAIIAGVIAIVLVALIGMAMGAENGKVKPAPFTANIASTVTYPGTNTVTDDGLLKVRDQIWNGMVDSITGLPDGTIELKHDAMINLSSCTGTYHATFAITTTNGIVYGKLRGKITNLEYTGTYPSIVFTGGKSDGSVTIQGGTGDWEGIQGVGTYHEEYVAPLFTTTLYNWTISSISTYQYSKAAIR